MKGCMFQKQKEVDSTYTVESVLRKKASKRTGEDQGLRDNWLNMYSWLYAEAEQSARSLAVQQRESRAGMEKHILPLCSIIAHVTGLPCPVLVLIHLGRERLENGDVENSLSLPEKRGKLSNSLIQVT